MKESLPTADQTRSPFVNALTTAAAVVIVLAGIHSARAILIPFLLAIFIAVIISAILAWLKERDINTGAAIILMTFFIGVGSLIMVYVVGNSIRELVYRLPEIHALVTQKEEEFRHQLEKWTLPFKQEEATDEAPDDAEGTEKGQSVEFSVPKIVPTPEDRSLRNNSSLPEQPPPNADPSTTQPPADPIIDQPPPVFDSPEMSVPKPNSSAASDSSEDESNPTEPESAPADMNTDALPPDLQEQPIEAELEPTTVITREEPANPFGLPGFTFGEQKHVIHLAPTRPVQSRNPETLMDSFSPVQIFRYILDTVTALFNYTLIVLLMLIFLLLEWSRFGKKMETLPGDTHLYIDQVSEVFASIRQYMFIKTMVSLLTGFLVTIWLMLLGVEYAALWGTVAFLFNYIPTIGSIIAGIVPTLYVLVDQSSWLALHVALAFVVVNFLVGNILEPRVMGQGLGLSTFVVFLSLVFWGWLLGPAGMLLAVPLTMTLKIAMASDERTKWFALLIGAGNRIDEKRA